MTTKGSANAQEGDEKLRKLWDDMRKVPYLVSDADSFAGGQGFWHGGNTLDTFMDYLGRAKPDGYQKTAAELADQGIAAFKNAVGCDPSQPEQPIVPTGKWWDDYGWWGLAFLKVYALTSEKKYLACARTCWHFMEKGGRHFDNPPPEVAGGTWNHDPNDGGVQNTITNCLFLNLSAQMYKRTGEEPFLDCACAQFQWFWDWFKKGQLWTIPEGKLIKAINEDRDWCWTGDQGALLGWVMSLRLIAEEAGKRIVPPVPNLGRYLVELGESIASAAMTSELMVRKTGGKSILHEQVGQTAWCDVDWATGKGVLIRYLAAWLHSQGSLGFSENAKFIRDNAEAVSEQPPNEGYFPMSWAGWEEETNTFKNPNGYKLLNLLTFQCSGQDAQNASLLIDR